jgi:serine/threonine protein kinase
MDGQCPRCLISIGLQDNPDERDHLRLTPGSRLGSWEIEDVIGEGGVGVVYRARDTRLNRHVAVKFLSDELADAVTRRRFQREAQMASALNHPHILAVYDAGEYQGCQYLVTEYVDGGTLKDWARSGKRSFRQIAELLSGVADGLAAAHSAGILHRDIKPGNILVTLSGYAKLADFGLAKLVGDGDTTRGGTVLGTIAYMSPEQASGLPLDARSDIFSFGIVLYELLSGRRPFSGETDLEALQRVIHQAAEPLGMDVPVALRSVVEKALEKDPADRYQSMRELAIDLKRAQRPGMLPAPEAAIPPVKSVLGRQMLVALTGVLAVILGDGLWAPWRKAPPAGGSPIRFQIPLNLRLESFPAVSPDGRYVALRAVGSDGVNRIWVRAMDSLEARPLPGSESNPPATIPPIFWSPDSRFIAFDAGGKLKKIEISGGLAQTLCDLPGYAVGGSWNRDGVIIFGNTTGGLLRVSEAGGTPVPVTAVDPSRRETYHVFPWFLPDGRHFLYLRASRTLPEKTGIYVGSIDARPAKQDDKRLLAVSYGAAYVASPDGGSGQLLYLRDGKLFAQTLNARRPALTGAPVLIADRVASVLDGGFFSASTNGILVYSSALRDFLQLTWFDRRGNTLGRVWEPGRDTGLALSPDGTQAAVSRVNSQVAVSDDIWLLDLSHDAPRRFTSGQNSFAPVWSSDGSRLAFSSYGRASLDLFQKPASTAGKQELLLESPEVKAPASWSQDGRFVLYAEGEVQTDLWALPLTGDSKPVRLAGTHSSFGGSGYGSPGTFSPDGRWMAWASDDSGRDELYVQAFPDSSARHMVSRGGGVSPRWPGDGHELFYQAPDGKVMTVGIVTRPALRIGEPRALFALPAGSGVWDVTADGKRFLAAVQVGGSPQTSLTVVLNWTAMLRK